MWLLEVEEPWQAVQPFDQPTLDLPMSMEIPAQNLKALVDRVSIAAFDHIITLEKADAWLETFLKEWALDEEKFFVIALEKEEMDMYNRALSLHLIGQDEVTPKGFPLDAYQRPSVIRETARTAEARVATEQREMSSLKERRLALRQSLARTNRLLHSLTSKLVNLKAQVSEHDRKLVDLNRDCDTLISACAQTTLENLNPLSNEFASSIQSSGLLQRISLSLQKKYQFIESLSKETFLGGTPPEDFRQASWVLSRAFRKLEDRMYGEELLKILEGLSKGAPWVPNDTKKERQPASAVIINTLRNAWRRDETIRLSYREEVIQTTAEILQTQVLPPLTLLYSGLRSLQAHVSNVHAQCVVLLSEFERFARTLHETESQVPLNEEDDLLIRLSTLLRLDPGEQGELSAEAVLDQLAKLKLEG